MGSGEYGSGGEERRRILDKRFRATIRLAAPRSAVNWFRRETKSTEKPVNRRTFRAQSALNRGKYEG